MVFFVASSLHAFAKDYSYSCVFENGAYVKVKSNGKKFKLVQNNKQVIQKIVSKGATLGYDASGSNVSRQLWLGTKDNAENIIINFKIKDGKDLVDGQALDATLSLKDAPASKGMCIKNL